jgi:hypothetical protein
LKAVPIDHDYLLDVLLKLLFTPSPSGYTDRVVHLVCEELERMGVPFELTRRGAIRATLKGQARRPNKAIVAHIDTLGAMVKALKPNGRLQLVPVGHWNARFAEGARCTLFTDHGQHRGTILPLKASGHTFGPEIDTQPSGWDYVEFRIDERVFNLDDLLRLGVHVGDFVAIDCQPEVTATGFINSRHLDDKAGAALLLAATKAVKEHGTSSCRWTATRCSRSPRRSAPVPPPRCTGRRRDAHHRQRHHGAGAELQRVRRDHLHGGHGRPLRLSPDPPHDPDLPGVSDPAPARRLQVLPLRQRRRAGGRQRRAHGAGHLRYRRQPWLRAHPPGVAGVHRRAGGHLHAIAAALSTRSATPARSTRSRA